MRISSTLPVVPLLGILLLFGLPDLSQAANRLKDPGENIDRENPYTPRVERTRREFRESYQELVRDYYRNPWDHRGYYRNYYAYARAWYRYQWTLYYYWVWNARHRVAFTGKVLVPDILRPAARSSSSDAEASSLILPTRPLVGAKVQVRSNIVYIRPGPIPTYVKKTDRKGAFSFRSLEEGSYTVTVSHPGYQTQTGQIQIEDEKVQRSFLLHQDRTKSVRGGVFVILKRWLPRPLADRLDGNTVPPDLAADLGAALSDPDHRGWTDRVVPVSDQKVVLTRTDPVIQIFPPPPPEIHEETTDDEGRFVFHRLEGDSYRLEVDRPGFYDYKRHIDLSSGAQDRYAIILVRDDGGFDDLLFSN